MMEALKAIPFAKDLSHHDASHHVKNLNPTIDTITGRFKIPLIKLFSIFYLEYYIMNIISRFSGRKPNLQILTRYLNVALDLHIINEVHFWNYARNPDDEIFIKDLCNTNNNFYFFDTNDKTNRK